MSTLYLGTSKAGQNRIAAQLVAGTLIVVVGLFVAARLSSKLSTGHYFDYLHWTIAYAVAAALAWMGFAERGKARWCRAVGSLGASRSPRSVRCSSI